MDKLYQLLHETELSEAVQIRFKNQSRLMHLLAWALYPINPKFMSDYTSTIGNTIYFPSHSYVQKDEINALRVLAHELVHVLDSQSQGRFWFSISYLFPQILVLGAGAAFISPWAFFFLLALLPWPAPFRFHWEARAYTVSWLSRYPQPGSVETYLKYFTAWDYYRMYPYPQKVRQKMISWQAKAEKQEDKVLSRVLRAYHRVRAK